MPRGRWGCRGCRLQPKVLALGCELIVKEPHGVCIATYTCIYIYMFVYTMYTIEANDIGVAFFRVRPKLCSNLTVQERNAVLSFWRLKLVGCFLLQNLRVWKRQEPGFQDIWYVLGGTTVVLCGFISRTAMLIILLRLQLAWTSPGVKVDLYGLDCCGQRTCKLRRWGVWIHDIRVQALTGERRTESFL